MTSASKKKAEEIRVAEERYQGCLDEVNELLGSEVPGEVVDEAVQNVNRSIEKISNAKNGDVRKRV